MSANHHLMIINQQILLAAADALRSQDAHLLSQLGLSSIDEATAEQLRKVSVDRLACLNTFRGTLLDVRLNTQTLRMFLGFAQDKVSEDDQINAAIRAGMRQPMLEELKGISRREFASRRQHMGLPEHTRGRIEVLSEEDELSVLRAWKQLESVEDVLDRYLELHRQTGIGLDQAYTTIKSLA
jgi:hypothetical protein